MSEVKYERISADLVMKVFATGLMSFCGIVSETAMNVTFPTLINELNVSTSEVQWLTTGYLLVLSLVVPLSSFLNKRFSARQLFFAAITLFVIGTIICVFAPHFSILVLGRLCQGTGTGIALPLMFNIILSQTPKSRIGVMMGMASLICATAPAVGPVLGGVVVGAFGWRMIFVVLLPCLFLALVLGLKSINATGGGEKQPFDKLGYLLLAFGFTAFVYATEHSASAGWLSVEVVGLMALSGLSLSAFAYRSLHNRSPLVNLSILKNRGFSLTLIYILIAQFTILALGYLIPNYAQLVSGSSTFIAGVLLLPGCVVSAVLSPIAGKLYDKLGAAKPIMAGGLVLITATALFAVFSANLDTLLFMAIYTFFALGVGLSTGNSMTFALSRLNKNQSADGNAVINTLQQLSGAVGTSVVASLVATAQASNKPLAEATLQGSQWAFILLFGLIAISFCAITFALKSAKSN